ncbi:hypothetical protein VTK56DRAFT_7360 [Thermocarpiscus australiensis]
MRRCIRCSRHNRHSRSASTVVGVDESSNVSEKRFARSRGCLVILLTAIRFFQFAYCAFAYYSLSGFQRSSYFREDRPWHHSPDQTHQSMRMMHWIRTQAFAVLTYHTIVLLVPCLLRMLKGTQPPSVGLTAFGDGFTIMASLNILVLLSDAHETYCHSPTPKSAHGMLRFGKPSHENIHRHRSVCRLMDAVYGLGGIFIISLLLSAFITMWRVRKLSSAALEDAQRAGDVEEGIIQHHAPVEEVRPQAMLQRQHTPPPPYHPVVTEMAQEPSSYTGRPVVITANPRSRPSMETTSSVDPEAYLVSDGWRPPEEPPEYSSRPPSLHNLP